MGDIRFVDLKEFKRLARAGETKDLGVRQAFHTEVKAEGDAERVLQFTISSAVVDRDGDTINVNGWDLSNYNRNPVVLWAHLYHEPPVAKSLAVWVEDGKLKSRAQFTPRDLNAFGFMVYRMYREGYLNATSVGFIPKEWKFTNEREGSGFWDPVDFLKQELLEYSAVPVPSNPEALVEARSKGIDTAPMLEWAEKVLSGHYGKGLWLPQKDLVERIHGLLKPERTISTPPAGKGGSADADPPSGDPPPEPGDVPQPVVVETQAREVEVWKCPHCQQEIGEKELFAGRKQDPPTWVHAPCGGSITLPSRSASGASIKEPSGTGPDATKGGRVLSAANENRIRQARDLLDEVFKQVGDGDGDKGAESPILALLRAVDERLSRVEAATEELRAAQTNKEPSAPTDNGGAVDLPGDQPGDKGPEPQSDAPFLELADEPPNDRATIEVDEGFVQTLREAVRQGIQERMTALTGRVD